MNTHHPSAVINSICCFVPIFIELMHDLYPPIMMCDIILLPVRSEKMAEEKET